MRGLRYHYEASAYQLQLEELSCPVPREHEVRIQIAFCGVCGSDVSRHRKFLAPDQEFIAAIGPISSIIGHEISGTITALGANVPTSWPDGAAVAGTAVVINPLVGCGTCSACEAGRWNACERPTARKIIGYQLDGGFAEEVCVPFDHVVRLPSGRGLPLSVATLAEPLAVAMHASNTLRGLDHTTRILIVGDGPIGLLLVHVLRHQGFGRITLVGRHQTRIDRAHALGATQVAHSHDAVEGAAPVVFLTAGTQMALNAAYQFTAQGGALVCLGYLDNTDRGFSAAMYNDVIRSQKRIMGTFGYSHDDFQNAVTYLANHHEQLQALVSAIIPLSAMGLVRLRQVLETGSEEVKALVQPVTS